MPLSTSMGFKPDKIFRVLKKVIGDELKKGDILAQQLEQGKQSIRERILEGLLGVKEKEKAEKAKNKAFLKNK